MINVYLDDFRPCPAGFVLAKNAEECILLLESEQIGILSLDFDLGWGQPTGLHVVQAMVERGIYPQDVYLHTSSSSGKMQMYQLLLRHAPEHVRLHNGPMAD
ncbi:cyclic-phosphate processing receiver domain-containing protein [Paenibacillus xanthanilyticus]|uniref:Cyclic-phosphate processing receiver domain-containing protein n=1 Tax=Paenibacillus xanthanilyticus TaxID=1783531 RepID=A0ABV8K515_9BACL